MLKLNKLLFAVQLSALLSFLFDDMQTSLCFPNSPIRIVLMPFVSMHFIQPGRKSTERRNKSGLET